MLTLKACFNILLLQLLVLFNNFNIIYCKYDILYYENSNCQRNGSSGVCTLIENCPTLNNHFINTRNLTDNELCSYKDDRIIVCCTDHLAQAIVRAKRTSESQYENNLRKKRRVIFRNDDRLQKAKDREYIRMMYGNQKPPTNTGSTILTSTTQNKGNSNGISNLMVTGPKPRGKRLAEIACDKYVENFPSQLLRNFIVGLKEKAEIGEFPHMVALGYGSGSYNFRCAGTLISENFVLTAAHCIEPSSKPVIARMGRNNIKDDTDNYSPIDVRIQDIITHRSYKSTEFYNDIALLKLAQPVKFNNGLHPACLYTKTDDLSEAQKLVITGWGITDLKYQRPIDTLQKANVRTVPLNKCAAKPEFKTISIIPRGVISSQICAYSELSDTCEGDSGGPLLIEDRKKVATVIGITSFGMSCGTASPGLYTRVAYYLDWIESVVWS